MAYRMLSALLLVALMTKAADAAAGALNDVCITPGNTCTIASDHICDTNRVTPLCKIKVNYGCNVLDACVAGSSCSSGGMPTCLACDATTSTSAANLCTPNTGYLGGACPCTAANTECNSGATKCVCKTGFTAKYSTYSCLASLGTTCSADGDCYDSTNNVCDLVAKVCRIRPTKTCTGNTDKCVTGAACTGSSNTLCECGGTYTVDSTTSCKPNLGTACTATAALACNGADNTCDPYSNTCKIGSSKTCASGATTCTTGASCTTVGGTTTCVCDTATTVGEAAKFFCQKKIASGAACTYYDKCTDTDSVCDLQLGVCAKKATFACTASDTCVSGSTCSSATNKCVCASGFTETSGLCVAVSGKPGGTCSAGTCNDTNSECKTTPAYGDSSATACYCKTNFKINPTDGICLSAASSLSMMTGFVTVMAALFLGFHM